MVTGTTPTISQVDLDKLISLTIEIKKLEDEKDNYVKDIKAQMLQNGQDIIMHKGSKIALSTSTRNTIKKNMKDTFILFLKGKGLSNCLKIEADIDKDILDTEVNMGNITKEEVEQYMSSSEVVTMRITV